MPSGWADAEFASAVVSAVVIGAVTVFAVAAWVYCFVRAVRFSEEDYVLLSFFGGLVCFVLLMVMVTHFQSALRAKYTPELLWQEKVAKESKK